MGKKKNYKPCYLQKQKKKMCLEGELESYVAKQLAGLEAEVEEEVKKEEERKKKRVEEVIAFQKHMEKASYEPIDYKKDLYFIPNTTNKDKAYKVTFLYHPEYHYIAFAPTQAKAEAAAHKYIRETYYPTLSVNDCPVDFKESKGKRCPELDEYALEGKAPISALLKMGMTFKCSGCGKIHFNYEDYATRRCFIVEGEGDIVPYAKGMIFCYSCYNKYFT